MWVKRTESEIAEERRRQGRSRLRAAALFGVFLTLVTALTFGSREIEGRHRFTVPTSEILSRLPLSIVFGAVAALAIYKFQRTRPTMICPHDTVDTVDAFRGDKVVFRRPREQKARIVISKSRRRRTRASRDSE